MKKILLLAVSCFLLNLPNLIAQSTNSPFVEIEESIVINAPNELERVITPNNYQTLLLDTEKLASILESAPHEDEFNPDKSAPFEVILPNGNIESFYLTEYTMMEPRLAERFSSFKTYHGYGVTNPNHRIRLDWTVDGLNAMMLLPDGLAFVKPYSRGESQHYLSYYESDLPANLETFECGTIDEKINEPIGLNSLRAGDCEFRTYRLAIAVTGEYATNTLGASSAGLPADDDIVTAHIVTSINQINGWYERDVGARFILINNLTDIFYFDGATDPYTNSSSTTMLGENISNLDAVIGSPNFDLGHVLGSSGGGSGGVAGVGVLCGASKARGVTQASAGGITQPRFLKVWSHEMGHQFGAGHTQGEQCQRSSTSAMEPGAGSTLMSYVTSNCANQLQSVPDYYFHAISIQQMSARMLSTSCAAILPSVNSAPTISAGPNRTVPSSTPLLLQATASDLDDDALTYTWEQYNNDLAEAIPPQSTNTQGPSFRSFPPSMDSDRYLPNLTAVIDGTTPTWEVLPSVARTMDFRVTVRDNSTNSISCTAEDDMTITTVADGPFLVTSPTTSGVIWVEGETHNVSWDVAGTNLAPVSCANVDILLSYDGGLTYPTILANSVPNDGSQDIVTPIGLTTTARVQVRCSDNIFFNISAADFEIQLTTGPTFLLDLPSPLSTICPGALAENIPVNTNALAGFSGDVDLEATNLPGSAAVVFANPTIPAGSGTTFEIINTEDLLEGNYTFTITGVSGTISRDFNYVLTVEAAAGETTLDLPADNEIGIALIPSFSWQPKSNASSYTIQVSEDSNFGTLIVNETVTTNSYTMDMDLDGGSIYFWRAKATTSCGETPWSLSRQFTTADCTASFIQNTTISISASGTPVINSVLTVTGPGNVDELFVSNILGNHTYVGDLSIELIAPGGSPIAMLLDRECGSSDDFDLSFSDSAIDQIADAPCSPLGQGGTFQPEDPLSVFNGIPMAGDWTLRINDNANFDGGELNTWSLSFCTAVFLPVDLLSFDAIGKENTIELDWKTANETDNAGFDIERRSETEREFSKIGAVPAMDVLLDINNYRFVDKDVRPGIQYYYRLRQNDFDGKFEYSPIRTARIDGGKLGIQVFPNPANGAVSGILNVASGIETNLRLFDLNGRIVKEQLVAGNQFQMDLAGLPVGVYILKARDDRREEIIKLVVK